MTPQRRDELLGTMSRTAQMAYAAIKATKTIGADYMVISEALKAKVGYRVDGFAQEIALADLCKASLIRHLPDGRYRCISVHSTRKRVSIPATSPKPQLVIAQKNSADPLDCWTKISEKLRMVINEDRDILSQPLDKIIPAMGEHFSRLSQIANDIDSTAQIHSKNLLQFKQFRNLLADFVRESA